VRSNTGTEEQAMRAAIVPWFRKVRGGDCRVIHEIALGDRRIDLLFVFPADLVGFEIKGPRDTLTDGRMDAQLREYNYWLPEVWLAIHDKWVGHDAHRYVPNKITVCSAGSVVDRSAGRNPRRDEMCCSRLLDLLWNEEVGRIGARTAICATMKRISSRDALRIKGSLARLLTGHEIMKQVCAELRSRPLTGLGSDAPLSSGEIPTKRLADLFSGR
jgi:hypothetical protein